MKEEHSFRLVPGLTPTVNVIHLKKTLLGKPYTHCISEPDYNVSELPRFFNGNFKIFDHYHNVDVKT